MHVIRTLCFYLCLLVVARAVDSNSTTASGRIIGGKPAKKGAYPEFVRIHVDVADEDGIAHQFSCGGTAIAKNLVLTAAHCLIFEPDYTIVGGTAYKGNIRYKKSGITADHTARFASWMVNPKFLKKGFDGHDMGIIVLKDNLPKPFAKLARKGQEPPPGAKVTVVGFGDNNDFMTSLPPDTFPPMTGIQGESNFPDRLYEVDLTVGKVSTEPCPNERAGPKYEWFTPDREFCLYGEEFYVKPDQNYESNGGVGIKNACHGDSGGPSFYKGVQVGVVSRGGEGMCSYTFRSPYSLHTKVAPHVPYFIRRVMEKYGR